MNLRSIMLRTCVAAAGAFAVFACGYEDDVVPGEPIKQALAQVSREVVTLATADQIAKAEVLEGSYIVTFRSVEPQHAFASYLTEYRHHYTPLMERYLSDPRVKDVAYLDHVDLGDPKTAAFDAEIEPPPALQLAFTQNRTAPIMATIAEVQFRSQADATEVLAEWEANGDIWFAEPNSLSYIQADSIFTQKKAEYETLGRWWHEMMNVYAAFDAMDALGVSEVSRPVIAVLDSGLDVTHPAFANADESQSRLWVNTAPGQSGCPGDVNGCDTTIAKKGEFGQGDVTPFGFNKQTKLCGEDDDSAKNCPHGTHVAGIIAAAPQSNYAGVCPFCRILTVRIFTKGPNGKGSASDSAILRGMKYLTKFTSNNKSVVRVINSSFGKYNRIRAISIIVSILAKNGILVVGAASNDDSMVRVYPSSINDAIAVAGLNMEYKKASYSNYGPWVDVSAPGGEGATEGTGIVSATPGGSFTVKSGTSMATPMVAGVAGLILTVDPNRSFANLRNSIIKGANPKIYYKDVAGGFNHDNYYPKIEGEGTRLPLLGSGIVDAACAVKGNCTTGLSTGGKDRVTQGCSVVGTVRDGSSVGSAPWLLLLALLLPVLALARCRRPRS